MTGCCDTEKKEDETCHDHTRFDWLLYGSLIVIGLALLSHFISLDITYFSAFSHAIANLLQKMWWGIVFGIVAVGLMQDIPREYFQKLLGRGDSFGGLIRAAIAGLFLDLCSHGILMIGAKLYERGASIGQVMTFLIASPWNSFSLTLILISLIGIKWTLAFIVGSVIIAIITGAVFMLLVRTGRLPDNPNTMEIDTDFDMIADAKTRLKGFRPTPAFLSKTIIGGFKEARSVMRWLFFGTIIAALIQAFVPTEMLATYFGASIVGLFLTLIATTIIEVCSEGSAPIGAELVNRAAAPGNGFTFLMAGVATDYTEVLVIRQFTKSWKIALFLPLITIPQILIIGYAMNVLGQQDFL